MGQEKLFGEYFNAIFENSNTFTAKEYKQDFMKYELNCSKHLPSNRDVRILDIGCGTGHFLNFLKKKRYKNFLGIDISPQQVDFCKKNISQQVEVADAFEFLKGKDNYYDVIVANDLLEHIPKNKIVKFLTLVNKASKHGGVFLVKTPNLGNPFAIFSRYKDFTHTIGFTDKSLYQVLWIAGFRNIQILPFQKMGFTRKALVGLIHFFLRKLFWYQGFVAPGILTSLLLGVTKK
ncbi:MAG TPA: class I SAM-dependent methyltransferase [Nitrospirae bacterium]|nr:cyclopropane fatty acyl phospholipid synthase [bacterium BMS3Abin06]HDH13555.1 class I SAM-dependent methyltransferase [Nitrospirota bacterium]HDZ01005.1 class I SAM-dependent methyltransferase [Nitrospirota bacterium]